MAEDRLGRIERRLDAALEGQGKILAAVAADAAQTQQLERRIEGLEESVDELVAQGRTVAVNEERITQLERRVGELEEDPGEPSSSSRTRRTALVGGAGALGGLTLGEALHWLWSVLSSIGSRGE